MKEFWKSINISRSYAQKNFGVFFMSHSVHSFLGNLKSDKIQYRSVIIWKVLIKNKDFILETQWLFSVMHTTDCQSYACLENTITKQQQESLSIESDFLEDELQLSIIETSAVRILLVCPFSSDVNGKLHNSSYKLRLCVDAQIHAYGEVSVTVSSVNHNWNSLFSQVFFPVTSLDFTACRFLMHL